MRLKFDTDRIVSFSAIFISLITLIIFIYQTNLMRKQSKLSVLPRVSFNEVVVKNDDFQTIRLELKNKGLGPAIIESCHIVYKGKKHEPNFVQFFEDYFPQLDTILSFPSATYLDSGNTLGEKESLTLFIMQIDNDDIALFESTFSLSKRSSHFDVEIEYSSIYEEKWRIQLNSSDSEPLKL